MVAFPCIFSHPVSVLQTLHIWLGGLFTPEAYITATRQYVAQANNWSLEELYLDVSTVQKLHVITLIFWAKAR